MSGVRPYAARNIGVPRSDPEYLRRYREANPDSVRRNRTLNSARQAAQRRLAALHPEQFDALYADELAKRGIQ